MAYVRPRSLGLGRKNPDFFLRRSLGNGVIPCGEKKVSLFAADEAAFRQIQL
jgi:hypothetical protein